MAPQALLDPPSPFPAPLSSRPTQAAAYLGRRTLEGVAIQQNDLQVPEAAEGDGDPGDAVTGEIQADQRKVSQL